VTSAFILEVNSELKPDPNEETAALLRVLIYKVDNTTFGGDVPVVPQWTGPSYVVVQVQAILFASLAASLLSAFLAMLGKQWLKQYMSVNMRRSAIERSQNRQRKLDGIKAWYFDHVMQSLPLMLQMALLLLGGALSRYLWGINITVASVVIGVTSLGSLFYLFIVIAVAAFPSCPYQTPGSLILRYILHWIPRIPTTLHSVFSASVKGSTCHKALLNMQKYLTDGPDTVPNAAWVFLCIICPPIPLIMDAYKATHWLLVACLYSWLQRVSEHPVAELDLHCILWTLQTSLDETVRLSALNYLTMTPLANIDSTLVAYCLDTLYGCIKVVDNKVTITQGMDKLAPAVALCCLHAVSHLTVPDPAPTALRNARQKYARNIPFKTDLSTLPFSHTLIPIHMILHQDGQFAAQWTSKWENYKPSSNEHAIVAYAFAENARFWHQVHGILYLQDWLFLFVLHSLSQSPLPSTSVVVNCLSIIALALGCDTSDPTILDGRYVHA